MGASPIKWVISTQSDPDGSPSSFLVKAPQQGALDAAERFETERDAEHVTAVLDNPDECHPHPVYVDAKDTPHLVSETAAFTVVDLVTAGYTLEIDWVDGDDVTGTIVGPGSTGAAPVKGGFDEVVQSLRDLAVSPPA